MEGVRTLHIEGQGSFRLRIPIQQLQIEDLIAVLRKARLDKIVLYIGFISDGTEANCPLYDDVQSGQRVLYKVQKPDNCTRRGPRIQIQFQNSYINKCLPFFMFMSSQYIYPIQGLATVAPFQSHAFPNERPLLFGGGGLDLSRIFRTIKRQKTINPMRQLLTFGLTSCKN